MEDQNYKRSRSRSRSQSHNSQHPIVIIIPQKLIDFFAAKQGEQIVRIRDSTGVQKIHFSPDLKLENFKDGFAYIYDESMEFKLKALQAILELIQSQDEGASSSNQIWSIMIPEPAIGQLIGKNGTTIKQIQKSTNTEISIKKEIRGLEERKVDITGSLDCGVQAIMEIYKIVEKGANKQQKQDQGQQKAVKARFIFPNQLVGYIIGKQGAFTKELNSKYSVKMQFLNDQGPPCRNDELICILQGDLPGVQKSIHKVFEKVQDYIKNHKIKDEGILMLIPSNLVSKLIGQGGHLIKEISQRSKGCSIKVMSEKNQENISQNVIVQLAGSLESKQLASTIILEKLEEFQGKVFDQQPRVEQEEQRFENFRNENIDNDSSSKVSQFSNHKDRRENKQNSNRSRYSNSRSPQRNQSHNNYKTDRRKDSRDLEKSTFLDRDGEIKVSINVIVPNNLVAMLIGRNGNIIKDIMNKTGAQVAFFSEQDCVQYKTPEGNQGRICQLKGNAQEISHAFESLINQVIRLENNPPKKETN